MIGLDDIRDLVSTLPETVEQPHFGRPAFRVRDKLFLSVHVDEERPFAIAHVSQETATVAVAAAPDSVDEVWRTHGSSRIFVGLRIDLHAVTADRVRDLAVLAWRHRAPTRLVAAHDDTTR